MAETADIDRQQFEVVRRGYDIDQVDEFLVRQAEAWRGQLYEAQRRISELEEGVGQLSHLEAEVEQARRQQEALTLTFQTAAQAKDEMLAKAEREAAEHRRATEEEMLKLRVETETETTRLLAEATAKADDLVRTAETEAAETERSARARVNELLSTGEQQTRERQAELDANHVRTRARYRQAEEALSSKVEELNSMRIALVAGLEAIASGGLAALEGVGDQLAAVGIGGTDADESAVQKLLDKSVASYDTGHQEPEHREPEQQEPDHHEPEHQEPEHHEASGQETDRQTVDDQQQPAEELDS